MKKLISYLFVFLFIFQGLMFIRQTDDKILPYENRAIKAFPVNFHFTSGGIKKYFSEIDAYFNDRIIGREHILLLFGEISIYFNESDINKVIIGNDGWLFLGNDVDHTIDKLVNKPSRATMKKSESYVDSIIKKVKKINGPEVFIFLGPNKNSIYPEYLPRYIRPAAERYVDSYLEDLLDAGLTVIDPTEALLEAKNEGKPLYWRSDTHWNFLGASKAFEVFFDKVNDLYPNEQFKLAIFSFKPEKSFNGDLIAMGNFIKYQAKDGDNFSLIWSKEQTEIVKIDEQGQRYALPDGGTTGGFLGKSGKPIRVINPEASTDKIVWFYHDSFGTALSPFFHLAFKETWHFSGKYFLKDFPTDIAMPDIIVFEFVERRL